MLPTTDKVTPPSCPVHNSGLASSTASSSSGTLVPERSPAQCPTTRSPTAINPRNNIPYLSQSPEFDQVGVLPVIRTISSIPRSTNSPYHGIDDDHFNWEYPSPQQFYNALRRKGWNTRMNHVEAMVSIHNRLNEDVWAQILKWESRRVGGMAEGGKPELLEFAGIHSGLSHKAAIYQFARRLFPSRLRFAPPFDRHDWIVRRPLTNEKVRYIIDYYSLRKSAHKDPEFYLDVRPAMDSFGNFKVRLERSFKELLSCARGSSAYFLELISHPVPKFIHPYFLFFLLSLVWLGIYLV